MALVLNDKLYYGLLYRLEKVIDNIKNNNYQQRYCKYQKLYPEFSMYSKSILDILQERYNIQIPKQEELYIHHYLKLSKSIIENYELPMIFIFSNPTTLRNFSLFVESFKSDLKASFLDINLYNFTQKKQELLDTIKNHNKSKGILIITDESLPTEIVTFIAKAFFSFEVEYCVIVKKTDNTKKGVIIKNIFKNVEIKISIVILN